MLSIYIKMPLVATSVGLALLGTSTALNVSYVTDGGTPLLSPTVAGIVAVAVGSAAAVRAGIHAWRTNRRAWAVAAFVLLACGETFALYNGAERLLTARELQARAIAASNLPFKVATQRVHDTEESLRSAYEAATAEALRGGCRRVCKDLQAAAEKVRGELEDARAKIERTTPPRSENIVAELTGWPAAWVEIGPALLFTVTQNGLAFVLLAIGHELTPPLTAVRISTPKNSPAKRLRRRRTRAAKSPKLPGQGGRAEQVAQFCRAFRDTQGREPTFTEVRAGTKLPNATVSKYRRTALG
jgi:hypothetical protein